MKKTAICVIVGIFMLDGFTGCPSPTDSSKNERINSNVVATPTANPQSGLVDLGIEVTLTSPTQGAQIYYTTDESDPADITNPSRVVYTDPIRIDKDTTIKAISVKGGMTDSTILTANYTINIPIGKTWTKSEGGYAAAMIAAGKIKPNEASTSSDGFMCVDGSGIYYSCDGKTWTKLYKPELRSSKWATESNIKDGEKYTGFRFTDDSKIIVVTDGLESEPIDATISNNYIEVTIDGITSAAYYSISMIDIELSFQPHNPHPWLTDYNGTFFSDISDTRYYLVPFPFSSPNTVAFGKVDGMDGWIIGSNIRGGIYENNYTGVLAMAWSPDGVNWTAMPSNSLTGVLTSYDFRSIVYGADIGIWTALAVSDSYILKKTSCLLTSSDGKLWTRATVDELGQSLRMGTSISYGKLNGVNTFVASFDGGIIGTSTDGITWRETSSSNAFIIPATGNQRADVLDVASGKVDNADGFIAVGSNGKIVKCTDGLNWEEISQTIFGDKDIEFIVYGFTNGKSCWIAYGLGTMGLSYDGLTWIKIVTDYIYSGVYDLCFGKANGSDFFLLSGYNEMWWSSN